MKGTVLRKDQLTLCCLHREHEGGRAIKEQLNYFGAVVLPAATASAWGPDAATSIGEKGWQLLWCSFTQCHWAAHSKWTSHKEWQDISDVAGLKNLQRQQWPLKTTKAFLPCSLPSAEQSITSSSSVVHLPLRGALPRKRMKNQSTAAKNNSLLLPKYLYFLNLNKVGWYNLAYIAYVWDCRT